MHPFENLSSQDLKKIEQKLDELRGNTGQMWEYAILQQPQSQQPSYLEIVIDGRTARPIALEDNGAQPADRICNELDKFFQQYEPAD